MLNEPELTPAFRTKEVASRTEPQKKHEEQEHRYALKNKK